MKSTQLSPITATCALAAIYIDGASDEAKFLASRVSEGRQRLRQPYSLGMRPKGVFDELAEVTDECSAPNWDGYGSVPVSQDAFRQAYLFLESLPLGTPPPSVGAETDGHITFEWYSSSARIFSVSISPDGELHYAALIGPNKAYGTEAFFGEVPATILKLVNRVTL
jgi:hypothetical protein